MTRRPPVATRSGAAAVEFAVVMNLVLVPMMIGVWELGRVVYVQQLVATAAREGARLAAQANTISATGAPTQIVTQIPPGSNATDRKPNVKAAVVQSLVAAGLTNLKWNPPAADDVTVTFRFLSPALAPLPSPAATAQQPATAGMEPWQGIKGQRFSVYVKVPYDKVSWSVLKIVDPPSLEYTVEWRMLVDDTFTINTVLPGW